LLLMGLVTAAGAKDLAVVVNKANSVKTLSMAELVKVSKGETGKWPDGRPVTFVTRDPASPEMKIELQKIYGITPQEVAALINTANHGRTDHPAIVVLNSDEAVVKRVESTPGAVGVVDVYSITGGISVLKIGGKLPLEPGYALHGN
jgi:ABC-type phosphate transport system substrate-binding protein